MRKYIDPEHLKAVIKDHTYLLTDHINSTDYGMFWCGIERAIDGESAADVRENRHGRWTIKAINTFELSYGTTAYEPVYECSVCGGVEESYLRLDEPIMPEDADFPKFCPNCGADMRGEKDG